MLMIPIKLLTLDTRIVRFTSQKNLSLASIQKSIATDGLLNPLVVIKRRNKYIIIDGKKRFKAIKALLKSRINTRALKKIPCLLQEDVSETLEPLKPRLMSGPELAHAIISQIKAGTSQAYIAQRYDCHISVVEDAASLTKLHIKVLQCFNNQTISLEQAAAFATIPNPKAQWDLLLQLGPFASNERIIKAIKDGETVITLPDENILIIPSRDTPPVSNTFDNPLQKQADVYTQRLAA